MGPDDKKPPTGRELFRNRAANITQSPWGGATRGRKYSPERLTALLDRIVQYPHVTNACRFTGISYTTLRYYLAKSEKGQPGDGFDLTYGEEKKRFHEHYADALDSGIQMVEDEYKWRALKGYYETLHDKGRVIYQIDPELAGLGLTGPDAYLLDEDGKPIPERIHHQDPEVMLAVLRAWRRDKWGAKESLDVNVRGGVMVVGMRAKDPKEIEQFENEKLGAPLDVEFREVENE